MAIPPSDIQTRIINHGDTGNLCTGGSGGSKGSTTRVPTRSDALHLEDLGSSNGTFIHDQRIKASTPLKDGTS